MTTQLGTHKRVRPGRSLQVFTGVIGSRNSVYLQAVHLNTCLNALFDVSADIHAVKWRTSLGLRSIISSNVPIVCHYDSFYPVVFSLMHRPQTVFVYHNHTPLRFYWNTEPLVAFLGLLTELQLRLMPKSVRWVAVSRYNERCLRGLGFEHVDFCPCVVQVSREIRLPCKTSDPSVLFVGRISPNKNVNELLMEVARAASILRRKVLLRIVGDAKPGSFSERAFRSTVSRHSTHEWLQLEWYPEVLSETELVDLYASSWLYASTSLHEGFGLPACEAVMHDTPALYLQCGGQESVLGQSGLVTSSQRREFGEIAAELLMTETRRVSLLMDQKRYASSYVVPQVEATIQSIYGPLLFV